MIRRCEIMEALHITCPNCLTTNRVPREKLALGGKCGECRDRLFSGEPIEFTERNFHRHVENTDVPIVIDFWASWCGPCHMFAPIFAESANALEPQVRLAKLDTEAHPRLAAEYGVRSIPTLVIIKGGREVARQTGAMNRSQFQAWVKSVI